MIALVEFAGEEHFFLAKKLAQKFFVLSFRGYKTREGFYSALIVRFDDIEVCRSLLQSPAETTFEFLFTVGTVEDASLEVSHAVLGSVGLASFKRGCWW